MATGTLNTKQVKVTQNLAIGRIPMDAGETQGTATFTYANPEGYKRIIVGLHIGYTESANYATVRNISYTIDETAMEIKVVINRDSGGQINPTIYVTAIDVPV